MPRVSVCQPASSSSHLTGAPDCARCTPASSNVGCAVPLKPSQNACSRAVEVRDADLGPRRALVRRIRVHERVRMQRDVVHDRLLAAALAVRVADGLDEADGRDRVSRRARAIVALRRHGDADHVDVRTNSLQRVVARRERRLVRRGRRDRAVGVERAGTRSARGSARCRPRCRSPTEMPLRRAAV